MLKSTVPTLVKAPVSAGGFAVASIANTSSSGSEKRTAGLQFRPSRSSHRPLDGSNLTMRPVSGPAVPWKFLLGAGRPPGITLPSERGQGAAEVPTRLTRCERWSTTQTPPFERAATATGSRPTGTEPACVSPPADTAKISSRSSGVLTANSRLPSGESASGRTWPLSKVTNEAPSGGAAARSSASRAGRPRPSGPGSIETPFGGVEGYHARLLARQLFFASQRDRSTHCQARGKGWPAEATARVGTRRAEDRGAHRPRGAVTLLATAGAFGRSPTVAGTIRTARGPVQRLVRQAIIGLRLFRRDLTESSFELRTATTANPLTKVLHGHERRHLLRHRRGDELVD